MGFQATLEFGKAGESAIAKWITSRGGIVLPVYEKIINEGKGPQLFCLGRKLIAPDILTFHPTKKTCCWVEAKHKTAFAWHRKTKQWVTGIDLPHYMDYIEVDKISPWPVWLLFLHRGGQAKDSPPQSPAGLFGNPLKYLINHESHRHKNGGKRGMVYWSLDRLQKLCSLDKINIQPNPGQSTGRPNPQTPGTRTA